MEQTEVQKGKAQAFYREAVELLVACGSDFMLGGGFAFSHYTGIERDTKDLDIFCKPSDYTTILRFFGERNFRTEQTDPRWIAKIFKDEHFIDLIFDTPNNICRVDETWIERASRSNFLDFDIRIIPPEELIWCKIYVCNRNRYDGADVNHLLLKCGEYLDWKHLLFRMNPHWPLLLAQLIFFQFVYPADFTRIVPEWLFKELLHRAEEQYQLPTPVEKVCRGPIIDQVQYNVDIKEWNYKVITMQSL